MGLDMYAYSIKPECIESQTPSTLIRKEGDKNEGEEICYWRKHHDLHGWMENLYTSKGGKEEFNCINLPLTKEDLEQLREDIKANKLPQTTGFFFGNNPPDKESNSKDLEFIEDALSEIDEGNVVYYSSWW